MNLPNWTVQYEVERWIKDAASDPVRQAVLLAAYHGGMQESSLVLSSRFGGVIENWIEERLDDESLLDALVVAGAWCALVR